MELVGMFVGDTSIVYELLNIKFVYSMNNKNVVLKPLKISS